MESLDGIPSILRRSSTERYRGGEGGEGAMVVGIGGDTARSALLRRDAFLVFRALCKLSMKVLTANTTRTTYYPTRTECAHPDTRRLPRVPGTLRALRALHECANPTHATC
eukprot:1179940-Prorocentrum_minimum.AAC.1